MRFDYQCIDVSIPVDLLFTQLRKDGVFDFTRAAVVRDLLSAMDNPYTFISEVSEILYNAGVSTTKHYPYLQILSGTLEVVGQVNPKSSRIDYNEDKRLLYVRFEDTRPDKVLANWLEFNVPGDEIHKRHIAEVLPNFTKAMREEYGD